MLALTSRLSHLQRLEAESLFIIREVVAECERPMMLCSIGKDSALMLYLAMKTFYPAKPPFPARHIDTKWKFKKNDCLSGSYRGGIGASPDVSRS